MSSTAGGVAYGELCVVVVKLGLTRQSSVGGLGKLPVTHGGACYEYGRFGRGERGMLLREFYRFLAKGEFLVGRRRVYAGVLQNRENRSRVTYWAAEMGREVS